MSDVRDSRPLIAAGPAAVDLELGGGPIPLALLPVFAVPRGDAAYFEGPGP